MLPKDEPSTTQIGELIAQKMQERGLSMKDLAAAVRVTYEHVRRVVKGESVPSSFFLRALCDTLQIPYTEAEKIATADRIKRKYGGVPIEIAGKRPDLEPLERVWDQLRDEQKEAIIGVARSFAHR